VTRLKTFLASDSASGVVLLIATLAALLLANSPWLDNYRGFLDLPVQVRIGDFEIQKPLLLWINDGLMAVFFFLVGLELKRELLEGELSRLSQALLPAAAALGGIAMPALIYCAINAGDADALRGWAIPAATDIAFAVGILTLFGSRVPRGLKLFLLTVAIVDDIGAIIIIALFYSTAPPASALMAAAAAFGILILMNRAGVMRISPYLLVGLVLWAAVLKSGVHATIAGVLLALTLPLRAASHAQSPARRLEHDLHGPVAFGILPLFAFANAGVPLQGMALAELAHPITMGIAAGLIIGKPLGIMAISALLVALGLARLPQGANWRSFFGVAILAGIGFTMSLFIGSLAFNDAAAIKPPVDERLGILLGSAVSAVAGYAVLTRVLRPR
jgi:NhaA family Na+:H+ antiporter